MNPLASLREPLVLALGWALVHFLWQGVLIALVLAAAHAAVRGADARLRYGLACGAMALMVLSAAGTFAWLWATPFPEPVAGAAALTAIDAAGLVGAGGASTAMTVGLRAHVAPWLPWLDALWLAGVFALSVRSVFGWIAAQKLKNRGTAPVDPAWELCARRLAESLGVSRPVRLSKSLVAGLPTVVGWIRPVILLPAGAIAGVDARQLEALLAHELAHIRRHDYLVNLLQTAAETLLFYHPAVWWVGRRIRIERENCCDDLAVSACGDVLTYARALTRLEEMRAARPQFVMAAGGGLLSRIRRLVSSEKPEHEARTWLGAVLVALTALGIWAGSQAAMATHRLAGEPQPGPAGAIQELSGDAGGSHQASVAKRPAPATKPAPQEGSRSFIGDLADAGYKNLTVDQLIAFKIHGVTPEYIEQLRRVGLTALTPDDLVAFRIHGVAAAQVAELEAAGFVKLTPDQLVAARIHGVTPEYARQMKGLGLGEVSIDQVIAMKIHGATPEFVRALKAAGVASLTCDDVIAARIHSITAESILEALKAGLKDLSIDRIIRLKLSKILSSGKL